MRKLSIITLCLLAIFGLARAADVTNTFLPPAITCSNQFIRTIAVTTGVGTCATVNFATDGTGLVPLANGGTAAINVAATAWTPADASGAALSFTGVSASYNRLGNMVFASAQLTYPATANTNSATISGFPINFANANYSRTCVVNYNGAVTTFFYVQATPNTGTVTLLNNSGAALQNVALTGATINFSCTYPIL